MILVFILIGDTYITRSVSEHVDTIEFHTKVQQENNNELILSIRSSSSFPKFADNYFIILTSEFDKIDNSHFKKLNEEITFINKDQDLYIFKIKDSNKENYELNFKALEREQDLKAEGFSISLKSQPYSLLSKDNYYLSKTFKFSSNSN